MHDPHFKIVWQDGMQTTTEPSNPNFPHGCAYDVTTGQTPACQINLPYPAERCGVYHVTCVFCGLSLRATTSGRADDPISIRVACKMQGTLH